MQSVTIAALELMSGEWRCEWDREAGERRYTYLATVEPRVSDGGQLRPLTADETGLLATAGFSGQIIERVAHADGEGGAAPSAQTIGMQQLQLVAAAHAAVEAEWLGQVVTLDIAPAGGE